MSLMWRALVKSNVSPWKCSDFDQLQTVETSYRISYFNLQNDEYFLGPFCTPITDYIRIGKEIRLEVKKITAW